ncbi:hypothetical protein [Frondihabitans peucedani]|uniref:Uncharacterized protein n=1 Tax=Frondihabitans peucedani TaxID=598626 RepID=A0ABP8E5Q8_9MICO
MSRLIEQVVPELVPELVPTAAEVEAVLDEAEAILLQAEGAGAGGGRDGLTGVVAQDPAGTRSATTATACLPLSGPWRSSARTPAGLSDRGGRYRSDAFPWARSPPS